MREQLQARLAELEQEFEIGEQQLRDIDLQQARLREALLRISGAIQVLREIIESPTGPNDSEPPETETASRNGHEQPTTAADAARVAAS